MIQDCKSLPVNCSSHQQEKEGNLEEENGTEGAAINGNINCDIGHCDTEHRCITEYQEMNCPISSGMEFCDKANSVNTIVQEIHRLVESCEVEVQVNFQEEEPACLQPDTAIGPSLGLEIGGLENKFEGNSGHLFGLANQGSRGKSGFHRRIRGDSIRSESEGSSRDLIEVRNRKRKSDQVVQDGCERSRKAKRMEEVFVDGPSDSVGGSEFNPAVVVTAVMASTSLKLFLTLLCTIFFFSTTFALNISSTNTSSLDTKISAIKNFCHGTPHPDACFNSLKLSISINISPKIIDYLLQTLQFAISEAGKLTNLFFSSNIVEKQRGTIQDCIELHQITLSSLQRSVSKISESDSRKLADARAYLSAALTNKNTCLEGLDSASGSLKPTLVNSLIATYMHVSNSLSMLSRPNPSPSPSPKKINNKNRRLLGLFPKWLSRKDRRILQTSAEEYDPTEVLTVAADGTGNFTTITDAINFAPNNSYDRIIIYVKEGVYEENVEIPTSKTNIVLLGDGSDLTVITGNRSVADAWTTFRSATLAVSGDGFLARDLTVENSAGPEKHQAVALRVNADLTAMYRCSFYGFQDTLYVHSFRQFYRECDIYGTIDYIFGNAAVVIQASNILSRLPMPGQFTVITAQSRDTPNEDTGISIQNCSILATDDLYSNFSSVKSYLGRPWRVYSRTVFLESYIDDFIDQTGWTEWSDGDLGLDTLYYGEYDNYGPGSDTGNRVTWPGYHVMEYDDAYNFTVSEFITGEEWLDSTAFPYDGGI
ncbi:hypothetical protein EZV62_013104 [Acer yangbiense]|uniref:Pectinesterase inhibitor domain-containing protein n=1 Tax=Acer yangbiense TaxID=1000413 RepID=A0A5C7HX84_9ROSI|nr:hypothetical protein EZV62_013104 [Acer yangbiense]